MKEKGLDERKRVVYVESWKDWDKSNTKQDDGVPTLLHAQVGREFFIIIRAK